jgi:ribonuclease HI
MKCHLFTDGACQPNPGKGGWAFILYLSKKKKVTRSGYEKISTNNRMEITAVLEGLKYVAQLPDSTKVCPQVTLFSDSKYVLQAIETWMKNWNRNGWKRKDKKPVVNSDLWKQVHKLLHEDKKVSIVSCVYVQGHSGHLENEECDQMAVAEIQKNK